MACWLAPFGVGTLLGFSGEDQGLDKKVVEPGTVERTWVPMNQAISVVRDEVHGNSCAIDLADSSLVGDVTRLVGSSGRNTIFPQATVQVKTSGATKKTTTRGRRASLDVRLVLALTSCETTADATLAVNIHKSSTIGHTSH